MNVRKRVHDFRKYAGQQVETKPLPDNQAREGLTYSREFLELSAEIRELSVALCEGFPVGDCPDDYYGVVANVAHESADVIINLYNLAAYLGYDLDRVLALVLDANDRKLEGEWRTDSMGKVLKPEGWKPAAIMAEIHRQASYEHLVYLDEGNTIARCTQCRWEMKCVTGNTSYALIAHTRWHTPSD